MPYALTALLLAFAATISAAENRIEFITLRGETRVAQSEVCFFAADTTDVFFGRYLSTDDVRCLNADAVLRLPPGLFNVYARNGSSLIDSHPTFIDNANPGEPGYRAIPLPLEPAATLDVGSARTGLREGEWLAVYLTNEGRPESLATIHPVPRGESKVLVPADMPFVPMVVRRGAIVRIGKFMRLRAGETQSLAKIDQWGSGRDVIALLRTDALTSPDVPAQPPIVELRGEAGEPLRPVFAVRDTGRFEGSLAIFKDVPAGAHTIRLSGEGWLTDESTVTIASDAPPVTTALPLTGRLAATVAVHASIGELANALVGVQCPNDEAPEPESAPVLRLLRCEGIGESRRCTAVRTRAFEPRQPEMVVRWSDLTAGTYVAQVGYPRLNDLSNEAEVQAGKSSVLTVAFQTGTVSGRVKQGGAPVQAVVRFQLSLAAAMSDESGNYTAVVEKSPKRSLVMVRLCSGGEYQYLPRDPIDKVLDIDIPKNELIVRVVDERGRPIEKANVVGGPLFPELDAPYTYLPFGTTDASGEARFQNVVTTDFIEMCAGLLGYAKACAPNFTMGDAARRTVEIKLQPEATMSGKLLSNKPFVAGRIYLVSASGAEVGLSSISPDGSFILRKAMPGEYLVADALSHPLTVLELPSEIKDSLEFEMPLQSRTITVTLSPKSRTRRVAMELAGRVIPETALLMHQMNRRLIHQLDTGQSLEFRDLGPGSLVVYSLPVLEDYPPEWKNLDPMEHPHLRVAIPRYPVTGPVVPIE